MLPTTLLLLVPLEAAMTAPQQPAASPWIAGLARAPFVTERPAGPAIEIVRLDTGALEANRSTVHTPLRIGERSFARGLGAHANCRLRVRAGAPIARFQAWVGVDLNPRSGVGQGSVVFRVESGGRPVAETPVLRGGDAPVRLDVDAGGAAEIELVATDAGDGYACDHADWAEAAITLQDGRALWLDELPRRIAPPQRSLYPFSFRVEGESSDALLARWTASEPRIEGRVRRREWTDPATGLRVRWEHTEHADFPAADWLLWFENTGRGDTGIVSEVQAADLTFAAPMPGPAYRVHQLKGGVPNPTLFEPATADLREGAKHELGAFSGRSSTKNMPFFKVETGEGAFVFGIEWSGDWRARLECAGGALRLRIGMTNTHFRLRPGERVRGPRVLVLHGMGDTLEANARFRELIQRHYAAKRQGNPEGLPTAFCNTCFTRGGGWLNETTAENQISLIRAYAKLGVEAVMTDAGWFRGGWPDGAGNWDPDPVKYPGGMGPVAAAAKAEGMVYGLWFEPERVMRGTWLQKNHPEWLLDTGDPNNPTYLLNFGLREVQDYFFGIVKGFMDLPGFRVYRQDFNMDPLPYWKHTDAPDRRGIAEMKYIEGLYAYWDRIRTTWPDAFLEECASGGHRIDLGTVMRLHAHQKSDYWFDDEVDQASLWGIGQYLPNNTIVAHLRDLDDYAFHSTLPSSLCLGWIADDPAFDMPRAKALMERYRAVRHLLTGAWYPLLPYPYEIVGADTRELDPWIWDGSAKQPRIPPRAQWLGSQFHRSDLGEGMLLAFRRPASPYTAAQVALRGLEPEATYELRWEDGTKRTMKGAELAKGFELRIEEPRRSVLVTYRRAER